MRPRVGGNPRSSEKQRHSETCSPG